MRCMIEGVGTRWGDSWPRTSRRVASALSSYNLQPKEPAPRTEDSGRTLSPEFAGERGAMCYDLMSF